MKESPYMTATGCPPGMVPVTKCPPKKIRTDETCCAQIVFTNKQNVRQAVEGELAEDKKQTNDKSKDDKNKAKSKITQTSSTQKPKKIPKIRGGAVLKILRVFEG